MKASDIQPEHARNFLRAILDRNKEREDGRAFKVIVHMTRDEAALIYGAKKWLDIYREWGVGLEEMDIHIDLIRTFLKGLVAALTAQKGEEVMTVTLNRRGLQVLQAAELHLDRYSMARAFPSDKSKGKRR